MTDIHNTPVFIRCVGNGFMVDLEPFEQRTSTTRGDASLLVFETLEHLLAFMQSHFVKNVGKSNESASQ